MRGGRGGLGKAGQSVVMSDEMPAAIMDHVLHHGMTMRVARQKSTIQHQ